MRRPARHATTVVPAEPDPRATVRYRSRWRFQLESPGTDVDGIASGDPVYGSVFNISAVPGVQPEGIVTVRYTEIYGYYYPDGTRWRMREPHYRLADLTRGPLAPTTVIKPRLAPTLMGVGLLERVPESALLAETSGKNYDRGPSDLTARWPGQIHRRGHPLAFRRGRAGPAQLRESRTAIAQSATAVGRKPMSLAVGASGCWACRRGRGWKIRARGSAA